MHGLQLRDAEATRELLREAQQRTAQLQADLMQTRQDAREASMAYQQERVGPTDSDVRRERVVLPASIRPAVRHHVMCMSGMCMSGPLWSPLSSPETAHAWKYS